MNYSRSSHWAVGISIAIVATAGLIVPALAIASTRKFDVAAERQIVAIRHLDHGGDPPVYSALSPDGKSVLKIQAGRLTIRPLESRAEVELLPIASISPVGDRQWAAWSADEKAIYYFQRGTGDVRRLDIASGKTDLLIKNSGIFLSKPSPSPDGKSIAFYRGNNIMLTGTDGKNERMVCDHCWSHYELVWSSDSAQILFGSDFSDRDMASLNLLTVATGQVRRLAPWKGWLNSVVWPSWSSGPFLCVHVHNQASAYSRWSLLMHGEPPVNWEIWHLRLPEEERTQVTHQPASYDLIFGAGPESYSLVAQRMAARADQWDALMSLIGSSKQAESSTVMLMLRK